MEGLIFNIVSSKNKTLLVFCFSFLIANAVTSWFGLGTISELQKFSLYLYSSIFIFLFFIILFWHRPVARVSLLSSIFILLGIWRTIAAVPDCTDEQTICSHNGQTVEFTGYVARDPDRRVDKTNYTISVSSVILSKAKNLSGSPLDPSAGLRMTAGNVLVQTKNYPAYPYGQTLRIVCKLKKPEVADGSTFDYPKYLAKEGIFSTCSFPKSVSEEKRKNNQIETHIMRPILAFKQIIADRINALWPEPEASFIAGILYGSRAGLPADISDNFSKTGITHIIAVSGSNITIIAVVLMGFLITIGFWRQQAFWVVLAGLWFFTIFSGLSASAVRAAIMGSLALVAQYLGRRSGMGTILVVTAALMALANPFMLLYDAGFQLSFLATVGLVYISPILENVILRPQPKNLPNGNYIAMIKWKILRFAQDDNKITSSVREALLTTMSAIIATTPLIMYQFGRLSLVAPLVNIFVLWIVPLLMLGGFIAVVLSIIFPLGQVVAYITAAGLKYVIMVANFFGNQRWSSVTFQLPWWGMTILYILLFECIRRKNKNHLPTSSPS